jgi:hypothetical protein
MGLTGAVGPVPSPSWKEGGAGSPGEKARQPAQATPGREDQLTLSPEALALVQRLKATDARVRAHEAAHLAAAGGLAQGGAQFTTTRGPDGRPYAVAGEVRIDGGGVPGDAEATLAKSLQVQRAALAPADPSPQDRSVAAQAAALAARARGELARGTDRESRSPGRVDLTA